MGKKIVNFFNKILGFGGNEDIIGLTSFEHAEKEAKKQTKYVESETSFTGLLKRV